MRFTQLRPGQRFRWKGAHFSKDGPLTAVAEADGSRCMVPRSASVELTETAARGEPPKQAASLEPAAVRDALRELAADLVRAADTLPLQQGDRATLRAAMDASMDAFRKRLGL